MDNASKKPDYRNVPGHVKITMNVYRKGDPAGLTVMDGRVVQMGYTLAQLREWLGGDEGTWREPLKGTDFTVSLKPFKDLDQENTYVVFGYMFMPDPEYAKQHPELFPSMEETISTLKKAESSEDKQPTQLPKDKLSL